MSYLVEESIAQNEPDVVKINDLDAREDFNIYYQNKLITNPLLTRALVSFQANKKEPFYRWFKYKEGFSTDFVKHILDLFGTPNKNQVVLDPFSGIGTALTTANEQGFNVVGIELLPHAVLAIKARVASRHLCKKDVSDVLKQLKEIDFSDNSVDQRYFFQHITITIGAFSKQTEIAIANFRKYLSENVINEDIKSLLSLIAISILEDVSYTRKDGQYLRWDSRSTRNLKSTFNKGLIYSFTDKLLEKLEEIEEDLEKVEPITNPLDFKLIEGSCLFNLNKILTESIDLVITSPPYCNRYDYTRTYALELAFTGVDNTAIKNLRQTLLSATVENKNKYSELRTFYDQAGKREEFESVVSVFYNHQPLSEIIAKLNHNRDSLNNKNIPVMISNYFFEMNFVIHELARTLKSGGKVVMVNDNVQYNGDEVPVDLILSDFASAAGLDTEVIWVLEKGKGNSSQQMGIHGRNEIRKCVYVWSKK